MNRTQIQFPEALYDRMKEVSEAMGWSLSELVRRATERFIDRFPQNKEDPDWSFPTINVGGDFLRDPAGIDTEADVINNRFDSC